MGYSKTQDTLILNNHTITTEYYEHKEEAFNSYLDEHFSQLESTITSLQPYAKNIHVKIYDDTPTEVFARTFQRWYNQRFEGNIWTIDTHMGPGERIANAVDFDIIDDYFCSTLKDLKVEKLNDLDFANKIQNIDTMVNEYVR